MNPTMFFILLLVMNLVVIHLAMFVYMLFNTAYCWRKLKSQILANGWKEKDCNPLNVGVISSYLIPYVNLVSARGIYAIMIQQSLYVNSPGRVLSAEYTVGPFKYSMSFTQSN